MNGYPPQGSGIKPGGEVPGEVTHPAGVAEVDALEVTPLELTDYYVLLLDLNELTQDITIRVYFDIAGHYRLASSAIFPTDFPPGAKCVPIVFYPLSRRWKLTLQSAVSEGADRSIPYSYVGRSIA